MFLTLRFCNSPHSTNTESVQCSLIKTDTTERFNSEFGDRTTGLRTLLTLLFANE